MIILEVDKWQICDLTLSIEKIVLMWKVIQRHQTLFSDLTRGDVRNFVSAIISENTLWYEVRQDGILIGIIWFEGLHLATELTAHMVFFDRRAAEKAPVCRAMVKWVFESFPIHRLNVTPPIIYAATRRLLKKIGFTEEGVKREAVLLSGKWHDQVLFGITRTEAEAL